MTDTLFAPVVPTTVRKLPFTSASRPQSSSKPIPKARIELPPTIEIAEWVYNLLGDLPEVLLERQPQWVQDAIVMTVVPGSPYVICKQVYDACKFLQKVLNKRAENRIIQSEIEDQNHRLENQRTKLAALPEAFFDTLDEDIYEVVITPLTRFDLRADDQNVVRRILSTVAADYKGYLVDRTHRTARKGSTGRRALSAAKTPEARAALKAELDAKRRAKKAPVAAKPAKEKKDKNDKK